MKKTKIYVFILLQVFFIGIIGFLYSKEIINKKYIYAELKDIHFGSQLIVENEENISVNVLNNTETKSIKFEEENMYKSVIKQLADKFEIEANDENYTIKIKLEDIEKVDSLDINNSHIKKLTGLENFTKLKELNISNNNITDISCLASLTDLETLKCYGNTITNLTPIKKLTNLKYLSVAKNKLSDLGNTEETSVTTNLSELVNIEELDISHNYLIYTSGLENLTKLKNLDLYDNAIKDFSGLSKLEKLETLKLGENNENGNISYSDEDLNILSNLTQLKYLDFSENSTPQVMDYISQLVNLETLSLEKNNISDVSNLENLTKLKVLNLYNNNIKTQSISALTKLENLEELNLGKTDIRNIAEICDENGIVWKKLKKIDLSGNKYIYTLYTTETNKTTRIDKNSKIIQTLLEDDKKIQVNYEYITDTSNLPHYDSNGVAYVTYDDFGARCDGSYDDSIAIRNAHIFANKNNCEVRATKGKTYHIFKYYEGAVEVKTNVNWNNATFIVHDEEIEEYSGRYNKLFTIQNINTSDIIEIKDPNWTINTKTNKIAEISNQLGELNAKGYTQYLCGAINSNKKQYIRYGSNANSGDNQRDYFLIDSEGNLLNDIQWDFEELTSFTIYPIPNSELNIKNGNFITNNLVSQSETTYTNLSSGKEIYFLRDIFIYKSANVNISGITHNLPVDELSGSYRGFIYADIGANINISDCELYSRKYSISGRSTYDLNIHSCVNVNCKNITSNSILDTDRWGIVATYFSKDVLFENCTINRIDAHQGIYNLTVKDCEIGAKNLTMTGQGNLNVIGTKITSDAFITLRSDYGSTWDGTINIVDSTYKYMGTSVPNLFSLGLSYDNYEIHDFGYDCKMPNINIENMTIDMQNNINQDKVYIMNVDNVKTQKNYVDNTNEFMKNYLSKGVNINKYNFVNSNSEKTLEMANVDLSLYLNDYNYVITDFSLKENDAEGIDIADKINENNAFKTDKKIFLEIKQNKLAQNSISVFKNDEEMLKDISIQDIYQKTFKENGRYKIVLSTIENNLGLTGEKIYSFEIDNPNQEVEIEEKISSKVYTIDNNEKIITNIDLKTTVSELKQKIESTTDYQVKDKNGNNLSNSDYIGTDCKIITSLGEYTLIVIGDLNGTGDTDVNDLAQAQKINLELVEANRTKVLAADLNQNGKIDINDLAKLQKIFLEKD